MREKARREDKEGDDREEQRPQSRRHRARKEEMQRTTKDAGSFSCLGLRAVVHHCCTVNLTTCRAVMRFMLQPRSIKKLSMLYTKRKRMGVAIEALSGQT